MPPILGQRRRPGPYGAEGGGFLGPGGAYEAYWAHVASEVGTSQEGEAMILLSYIRRLAEQRGVY